MIITVQCDMASPKVYPMKSIAETLPSPLLCHMVVFREDDVLVDDDAGDNEDGDDFEGELCVGREGGAGHLDVLLMFMKTWLRLNTAKLSAPRRAQIIVTIILIVITIIIIAVFLSQ